MLICGQDISLGPNDSAINTLGVVAPKSTDFKPSPRSTDGKPMIAYGEVPGLLWGMPLVFVVCRLFRVSGAAEEPPQGWLFPIN